MITTQQILVDCQELTVEHPQTATSATVSISNESFDFSGFENEKSIKPAKLQKIKTIAVIGSKFAFFFGCMFFIGKAISLIATCKPLAISIMAVYFGTKIFRALQKRASH